MGFDVLYLAPIHPIGRSHRKGPNNSEDCQPGDPGSPWAIGSEEGGHDAIHPELGTLADFDHFVAAARGLGLEIALDFAVQCSPDHPWVKQHPDWFSKRPDGTIKYAENPPKKYQDIYPINFDTEDREGLYQALLDVVLFWVKRGVRILRVDNPHTKPVSFWEWLISPRAPRSSRRALLGRGFHAAQAHEEAGQAGIHSVVQLLHLAQLAPGAGGVRHRAVPHRHCGLPAAELLRQHAGHSARVSAAGGTPGLHGAPDPGRDPVAQLRHLQRLRAVREPRAAAGSEEYLDSEKYQYKTWDWDRPGNIKELVTTVNRIRRGHPALALARNITFLESSNPNIIAYAKTTSDLTDVLVTVVNVDPHNVQDGTIRLVPELFHRRAAGQAVAGGVPASYELTDLLTESTYTWRGEWNYVRLDPNWMPAHILQIKPPTT